MIQMIQVLKIRDDNTAVISTADRCRVVLTCDNVINDMLERYESDAITETFNNTHVDEERAEVRGY